MRLSALKVLLACALASPFSTVAQTVAHTTVWATLPMSTSATKRSVHEAMLSL